MKERSRGRSPYDGIVLPKPAFALMELLVVLVILGLLGGAVTVIPWARSSPAREADRALRWMLRALTKANRTGRSFALGTGFGASDGVLGAFRRYGDVPRLIGVSISVGPPRHVRSRERLQPPMGDLHSRGYDPHRLRAEYGDPLFDPLGVRTSTDCCGPASGECGVSSFFM